MEKATVEGNERNDEKESPGGRLKRRLQRVQRRSRARHGVECEAVALRMRLIKTKEDGDL
jgi:hypothetical protein